MDEKPKRPSNTQKEYKEALASEDPTNISQKDLQGLAKEAVKKFKSMN